MISTRYRPTFPVHLLAALFLAAATFAFGDEAPAGAGEPAKPSPTTTEDADSEGGGLQAAKFMPLGKPNLKVKIPQFKDGELECVIRAEEMTRVGDELIEIKTMGIEFVEDGEPSMTIDLIEANYNLSDRLISSDQRAVVRRADFTLVGDSLEFDTVKRSGRMVGKVRMVIHDTNGFVEADDSDKEEGGDAAAAPAVASGPWIGRLTQTLSTKIEESEQGGAKRKKPSANANP